jgi:hypothetical protein
MRRLADTHKRVSDGNYLFQFQFLLNLFLYIFLGEDVQLEQPDEEGVTERDNFFHRILQEAARTLSSLTQQSQNQADGLLEDVYFPLPLHLPLISLNFIYLFICLFIYC